MKTCGIVAEYNPFHNGHAYHIQQAKKKSQADIMVAIMSGNYVQRGELSILDKWTRAQAAIMQGVDVVVELPSVFAIQSADYFGLGAMKIAKALQLDALSFGVEQGSVEQFQKVASEKLTTPKDFSKTYQQQWENQNSLLQTPNNQLAVAYIRAMNKLNVALELVPIQRMYTRHGQTTIDEEGIFASATAIRQGVVNNQNITPFVSPYVAEALIKRHTNSTKFIQFLGEQHFWQLLQYQVTMSSIEQLQIIYQMSEGIEYVLKKAVTQADSLDHFVRLVCNKRWHKKRVQRLCCYIVLQMTNEWVMQCFEKEITHLRVLGLSSQGAKLIRQQDNVHLVTQFKQYNMAPFDRQIQFDKLYDVMTQSGEQNFRRLMVNYNESYSKT